MKVILKENIKALGNLGEIINVSPGFARNYLMPRKLAIVADKAQEKAIIDYQKALSKKIQAEKAIANEQKKKVEAIEITLIKKVGSNGKLFGSVTTVELAQELSTRGIEVDRRQLTLDRPIKSLGQYQLKIKLFTEVEAKINIKIEIDPIQAEELKKAQKEAQERKQKEKLLEEKKAKEAEEAAKVAAVQEAE